MNDFKHWHKKALRCYKDGRYKDAISHFDEALKYEPDNIEILIKYSHCLAKTERYDDAIRCCNRILEKNFGNENALMCKGNIYLEMGNFEKSLSCYDAVLKLNEDNDMVWYNKGLLFCDFQRLHEALDCFDRALEIDPLNAMFWKEKGVCYGEMNQNEKALECFEKSLEIDGSYIDAAYNKGFALMVLGRREEAKSVLKDAGKRSKNVPELREMIEDVLSDIESDESDSNTISGKRNVFYVDFRRKKTPRPPFP
ncbi:MAG: tetratricopeptide repeat protein [Deltaproteobacteria bacterium]|nr:tetratricopeptide repeat protein [Deltaproteobacteria bacterium]